MRVRRLLIAASLLAFALPVWAQDSRAMALELWINGVCTHHTLRVTREGTDLILARQDLVAEGFLIAGNTTQVIIGVSSDVHATVDEANQRLLLTAPNKDLKPHVFDLHPPAPPPAETTPTGLTLNYDMSGQVSDFGATAHSALGFSGSASLFSPYGVLLASGFARDFDGQSQGARLDTAFVVDDPSRALRWTAGDAISGSLPWSQSVRFAGFQIATDYTLRPDLVTMPLPQFFGQTAVPASVDIFVGATRVFETDVEPGPFELHNLPIVTGGSDATIVTTDILGRQTTQTISLYDTGDLLAPGLNAYSLEAGFLRRDYGVESFGYDQPMMSATFRHGVSSILTAEAHTEISQHVQLAGGGIAVALEPYAVVDLDAAGSLRDGEWGDLVSAGFHSRWDRFTIFGSWSSASRDFSDLTTLTGAPMERDHLQLGVSASLDTFGSLSVSEIDQTMDRGTASHLATASYALDLGGRFLTVTGFYDRCANRWYAQATFDVLLGPRTAVTASTTAGTSNAATLAYENDADPDGGFGYRLSASAGENANLEAQGEWFGENLSANADLSRAGAQTGMRAGIDGTLVVMDDHVFATRESQGAVALVKTGVPDIPVYLEHRPVAVSDQSGDALVPGLVPFAADHISIDPNDYPIATIIETDERVTTPRRNGAVIVDLAPRMRRPLLVIVRLDNGLFPPLGAAAKLGDRQADVVVGQRGQLFIDDLPASTSVTIELPQGACRFEVQPPKSANRIPKIGPILCEAVVANAS